MSLTLKSLRIIRDYFASVNVEMSCTVREWCISHYKSREFAWNNETQNNFKVRKRKKKKEKNQKKEVLCYMHMAKSCQIKNDFCKKKTKLF